MAPTLALLVALTPKPCLMKGTIQKAKLLLQVSGISGEAGSGD